MRDFRRAVWQSRALELGIRVGTIGLLCGGCPAIAQDLPEAPSALHGRIEETSVQIGEQQLGSHIPAAQPFRMSGSMFQPETYGQQARSAEGQNTLPNCEKGKPTGSPPAGGAVIGNDGKYTACTEQNPLQPIVGVRRLPAMRPSQKGFLAIRDVIDPFNLITVVGYSGIAIAANSHTAYGPGFRGFGRLTGYSMVEDMQGEFVGTFAIPSLTHEDPRYYRLPGRSFSRRLLHAVSHTVITRHDDGTHMPNYATLLTYPISAELTNLYVPGVAVNAPSTAKRIGLGLATDPVGQIVAEFLPDVAKRIHIRVIFVQQILQQVAQGSANGPVTTQ